MTIAKSVGNGDVTLRNVTIKGDLIVKGGGSNTVTLEDVDVRGKVRLLKEGVHLHLVGDTYIRKLLIDLAARITQSSSYKDEIGEIILAGDGDLNKTTRIDVPAKQLRIENLADLILGGDVEKLIVDEDAKGAEIEIKKGTTVNELNTDAKIKLTGEGRIDLLNVSASGVTYDKNLDVRKKVTSNGATAPKENGATSAGGNSGSTGGNSSSSGGNSSSTSGNSGSTSGNSGNSGSSGGNSDSSGGNSDSSGGNSSTASKEITGAVEVTLKVGYGDKTAVEALAALPKTVTLNLKGGSTITATVTKWEWGENVVYKSKPSTPDTTSAVATVIIPSGYTYNGTLTATAKVTVHPLDKKKLIAAIEDAEMAWSQKLTDLEEEAAKDKTKILIIDGKTPADITEGVRFTTTDAETTLKAAISKAQNADNTGFASQKACDDAADALQKAMAAFKATIQTGTLNKQAFDDALKAANDKFNNTVYDEKAAATDKTKILIIDFKAPADITQGVRFTTKGAKNALNDAINKAKSVENTGSASQKDYDNVAMELRDAITAFEKSFQTGTNKTTDAYILQQVKDVVAENRNWDAPYSSYKQPLQLNYVYQFVKDYNLDSTYLTFEWKAQWKNQNETGNIGEYIEIGNVSGTGGTYSMGAKVIKEPNEPKEVQFVVTVKDPNDNDRVIGKLGENGEYSGTIGAPIRATLPSGAPQFTTTRDSTYTTGATKFTGVFPITLKGADAIKSVSNDCVTMDDKSSSGQVLFSTISVDKVEKSDTGLNVTVSVTTGAIGGAWNKNSSCPAFIEGTLPNIRIDMSKFELKTKEEGNLGWYLPSDKLNLGNMTVDVLTPAFTGVERADDPTTGNPTFTIQTQNMPENAKVEVALAKKDVDAANVENATIRATATRGGDGKYSVTFDKSKFESGVEYYLWFRYGSPGSDWAYEEVDPRPTYTFGNTTSGGESDDPGSSGPDKLNLGNMTVDVLTPAFTGVERADDPTTGNPTFTIQTQNMPENAKVEVALAKKDVDAANVENATIRATATRGGDGKYSVTFDKSKFESGVEYYLWFRYGSDWAYEKVDSRPTYTFGNTTSSGPDSSGPDSSGPDSSGPDSSGPDSSDDLGSSDDPGSSDPGNSDSSGPGSSDDPGSSDSDSSDSDSSGPSESGSSDDPGSSDSDSSGPSESGSTGGPDSSTGSEGGGSGSTGGSDSSSESGSSGSDSGKTTEGSQAGA